MEKVITTLILLGLSFVHGEPTLDPNYLIKHQTTVVQQATPPAQKPVSRGEQYELRKAVITFYCPCIKCNGNTHRITASGAKLQEGVTIAMPKEFEFGTKVFIPGVGYRVNHDTGSAIKTHGDTIKIDVYVSTHAEALKLGKYKTTVKIFK